MTINSGTLSSEAKIVWDALTEKQRKIIQKEYPIKQERNQLISKLHGLDIEVQYIAEVAGMSRQSISTILWKEAEPDKATLAALKSDLKKIQKAVGRLGAHIAKLEEKQTNR